MLSQQKAEAQQVLDELFSGHCLPFRMSAHQVDSLGHEEYIVRFHDSRLTALDVSRPQGKSFKDVFRAAILDRVKRLSGPLQRKTAA